jgi:hypothetical protein
MSIMATTHDATQDPSDVPEIDDWNRLLDGQVAVVTGGGVGIGGAISRLFARQGALVEIAEVDPERADRAVADIEAAGGTSRRKPVSRSSPRLSSRPTATPTCSSTTSGTSAPSYGSVIRRRSRGRRCTTSICSTSSP